MQGQLPFQANVAPSRGVRARNENTNPLGYESASQTRRMLGWRAPTVSPNAAILYSLSLLRDRSRTATRNDGYAKGAIEKLVSNIVGTGIKPLPQATDVEFRKAVSQKWLRWTDESDADGLLDFYGQQSQAVWAWFEGGEVFVRLRPRLASDGLSVPLQIQVIEPELCPHTHDQELANGNRIRAGIEFNGIGKRVAYWFHPSRPGDLDDFDRGQLRRVPAEFVLHMYQPTRPGQLRGVPHLTQALIRLHELDKFDDATLLRQQIANLFAGFIQKPQAVGESEAVNPLTGLVPDDTHEGRPVVQLEPGIMQELEPGEEMKFSDPPGVDSSYEAFTRQQLFHISAATGVPYEILTGDLSRVNDRTVRVILNEFRRRVQQWQHQIVGFQVCRPIWNAWLDRAFLAGALPMPAGYQQDPWPWRVVSWMPQRWPYLHPVQDVQAEKDAIRNGFTSRSAVVSEHGEDVETIDADQAADNARADELKLKYDSDGRSAGKAAVPGAPAPAADDEDGDTPPASGNPKPGPPQPEDRIVINLPKIDVDARHTIEAGAFHHTHVERAEHQHQHDAPKAVPVVIEKTLVRNADGRADGVIERHTPQLAQEE